MKRTTIYGAVLIVLLVCAWRVASLIWFKPPNIDHFFLRVFAKRVLCDPELLSRLRVLESYGLQFHNDDLTDASDAHARRLVEMARKELKVLRSYDRSRLTDSQRLSADILDWYLDNESRSEPFLYDNYPVNQLAGVQSELPTFMATIHHIGGKRDAENYIKRLSKFAAKFDQVLESLKTRESKGIVPPTFVIEKVLVQMRDFVGQDPRENILHASFAEKIDKINGLSEEQKQSLRTAVVQEIEQTVYPACQRLIAYCERLRSLSTTDDGVWKFPDGDAYYAYELRNRTTTDMTPDAVHELGLREVARIEAEMRTAFAELGCTGKSVGECLAELNNDPRFAYTRAEPNGEAILTEYQTILDEVDRRISGVFDIRPKTGVEVERIPAFKEKTAPAAYYYAPSLDGERPGIFYANLYPPAAIDKYKMKTLAYHEAIPGHHFQIAIAQELKGIPLFRKVVHFTAYSEGWALYAERLAWECGLYENDPHGNIGRLAFELFRAARLVVDTGIHHKRWTRKQAIAYLADRSGLPPVTEVERYIVDPGQACAYKIGELKILELRERARTELGERFDIKEFHRVVLQDGAMPLEILEKVVLDYIKSRKHS